MFEYSGDGSKFFISFLYYEDFICLGEVNDIGIVEFLKKSLIIWFNVIEQFYFILKGIQIGKNSFISGL